MIKIVYITLVIVSNMVDQGRINFGLCNLSIHCCLVVTCWERVDLLALVGDVYCYFHMWYPGSGVVLDCIVSRSLPPFLLWPIIRHLATLVTKAWTFKEFFLCICDEYQNLVLAHVWIKKAKISLAFSHLDHPYQLNTKYLVMYKVGGIK